jgi:hypothetical protein
MGHLQFYTAECQERDAKSAAETKRGLGIAAQ